MWLIINFFTIVFGGILGLILGKKISSSFNKIIVDCAGLFMMAIGIKSALGATNEIRILIYLVIGSAVGQLIDIDKRIQNFSIYIEKKVTKNNSSKENEKTFSKGFSTTTILFCVGAMAILGPINSQLTNDNTILNIKSLLDGVSAIVFSSIYGFGVIFSAFSVFIYESFFYLFAGQIKELLKPQTIIELNSVGGILILGISINMIFNKDIKIANMLPAIFIPLIVAIAF